MLENQMTDQNGNLSMVVFSLLGESFAVNVHVAREIIRLTDISPVPQAPDFIEGVIDIRGHIVAVMDPKKRFGLAGPKGTVQSRIMVVRANKMIVGLIIDSIFGVQTFSHELVQATPAIVTTQVPQRFISGIVHWNERIVFLLNLDEIFSPDDAAGLKSIGAASPQKALHKTSKAKSGPAPEPLEK